MAWILIYIGITLIIIPLLIWILSSRSRRENLILILFLPFLGIYKAGEFVLEIGSAGVRYLIDKRKAKKAAIEAERKSHTLSESKIRDIQRNGLRYRD